MAPSDRWPHAIEELDAAIAADPGFALPYWRRALSHDALDEKLAAGADHARALKLDPSLADS